MFPSPTLSVNPWSSKGRQSLKTGGLSQENASGPCALLCPCGAADAVAHHGRTGRAMNFWVHFLQVNHVPMNADEAEKVWNLVHWEFQTCPKTVWVMCKLSTLLKCTQVLVGSQSRVQTADTTSGKVYCISIWSLTLYEVQTGETFIVSGLNQYVVLLLALSSINSSNWLEVISFNVVANIVAISNSVFTT